MRDTWHTLVLTVFTMCQVTLQVNGKAVQNCNEAQRRCASQRGCQMALRNYWSGCASLIDGDTYECTSDCQMALISLLSVEGKVGEMFMTCDCGDSSACADQKSRLEVCTTTVMDAMQTVFDDTTPVSCRLATMICMADSPCVTALEYYHSHCRGLMRGERCTARCNKRHCMG